MQGYLAANFGIFINGATAEYIWGAVDPTVLAERTTIADTSVNLIYTGSGTSDGWYFDGNYWFFYRNGARLIGWHQVDGINWFYFIPERGGAAAVGAVFVEGRWQYFHPNGAWSHYIVAIISVWPTTGAVTQGVGGRVTLRVHTLGLGNQDSFSIHTVVDNPAGIIIHPARYLMANVWDVDVDISPTADAGMRVFTVGTWHHGHVHVGTMSTTVLIVPLT